MGSENSCYELSERVKVLENQLDKTELKFQQAFKYSGVGMSLLHPDGTFIEVNQMFNQIFGFSNEELEPKNISDLIHQEDINYYLERNQELIDKLIDSYEIDIRFIAKNKNVIWGRLTVSSSRDENNKLLFKIAQVQDVTEKKLTRKALKDNEKYSKIIAEISKELIRPELSIKKIADLTYKYALLLTKSKYGYVSSIDEETGDNVGHTLSEMMEGVCNVKNKRIAFSKTNKGYEGLWGYSLNTLEAFFTNEPEKHKSSRGTPIGHIPLINFLSVPVIIKEKLLGQVALANKDGDFNEKDLEIIGELANIYGLAIYRKNIEAELLRAKEKAEEKEAIVRKNSKRLEILLELNQLKDKDIKHLSDFTMEKAIELSDSKLGFLGFLNNDETIVDIYSWSSSAMKQCEVINACNEFEVEKGGLWSEAIKKRKVCIIDDFRTANPLKKGLPEGHVGITNFLCVPVFDNEKIVALLAVANKETKYNKTDVNQLALLADGMWNIIKQIKYDKELIQTKERVTSSENRLQRLVDNMYAGVAVCKPINNGLDFEFLEFNKSAERIGVERKQDIIGETLLQKYPNIAKSPLLKALQQVYISGEDLKLPPFYYKDNKREGWIESYVYKLPSGEVVTIFDDVSRREEYQQALMESEEKFRTIYEMAEDMICVSDIFKAKFIDINPSFLKKLGYSNEELLSKPYIEFIHPDDVSKTFNVIKNELQKGKSVINFINRYKCKNGKYRWFDWSAHPIPEKGIAYSIAHDITEIKKYQEELERHKNKLEELVHERTTQLENALEELKDKNLQLIQTEKMASLGVLTAGVAHEMNNPLNYIQSGIYGLKKLINSGCDKNTFDTKMIEIIRIIEAGIKKASNIVRSLGTFSKQGNEEIKSCNIHQIIENCLLILNYELIDKSTVVKKFSAGNPIIVGNEENLHQVFINLIMNSVQAIKTIGEIIIKTNIDNNKRLLEIIISDNGEGISEENLPKIFDPFFTTKPPGKGVGLGLSMVYSIILEHNGTINYKSEISKGTDVIISFPIK